MPVARPNESAEQISQRGELYRFPNSNSGHDRHDSDERKREIRQPLQRVVLSLMWMIFSKCEIELHHLPRVADNATTRNQIAPLTVQIDERDIDQPVHDEHPHHREVPVACTGQPTAERQCVRNGPPLERITAERFTATRERRIRVEDPQAAANHDRKSHDVHPMCDAHDHVMAFHAIPTMSPYARRANTISVTTTYTRSR